MNLSSLTSDNQDQSISSFFNESCNSVKGCCEYRSKYKEVYKDLSTIRIELRNLKNHDENLKNSLEGMQE
jgi:DNA repair ATPase RecN